MTTISAMPSLSVRSLADPASGGVESFLERHADHRWFYGSGKAALRDGLATVADPGDAVLLPAYLPDAVAEPLRELGLEPRYYAIEPDLSPDFADLESRLDDRTVAATSVDYFGFSQPGIDRLSSLLEDAGCYHVEDSAHSALSLDGDALLGTRGDVGVTSLRKLFPAPNGAVLYLDDSLAHRFDPSALEGVAPALDAGDCRFVLESAALDLIGGNATVKRTVEALVSGGTDADPPGPRQRYEASKRRMSALTRRVLADADPEAVRAARRANYRAWRRVLADRPDVDLVFDALPPGVCPQVVPVRAAAPKRFRRTLERRGVGGVHTWPRLPAAVCDNPDYETANRLSRTLLALPVHQHVDPDRIRAVGRRLSSG